MTNLFHSVSSRKQTAIPPSAADSIALSNKIEVIVKKSICSIFFIENCSPISRETGTDKFWASDNLDNSKLFSAKSLIFFRYATSKRLPFNFLPEFFKTLS